MLLKKCMDSDVKIVFELAQDGDAPYQVESLWAVPLDGGGYRIDNIPWYVSNIALGDVVAAAPRNDERLFFTGEILRRSGNRTIRVRLVEESIARSAAIHDAIERLGAKSELDHTDLLAVNAPADRLADVLKFLETGAAQGHWSLET